MSPSTVMWLWFLLEIAGTPLKHGHLKVDIDQVITIGYESRNN